MFKKILIANRGEIAVRVIQTCRDMGIATVAVYSTADETALHVLSADQAVCIGEADPSASYLNMDRIIRAAEESGAEAIHPGYGFLSENADFADRCEEAGITFIGPPGKVIREMGDKITARQIMSDAGVPVTPGLLGGGHTIDDLAAKAGEVGYPVLIKATAGGGGKGIRIVHSPEELGRAFEAASSEAASAFGNGDVYLEKFFTRARHIEFQILADGFGNTIHLLERECSIQRRHQKIIEETPSVAVDDDLRREMGDAAVAAARAAGYVNAGTVEFLLDENRGYYFLEMNTRLQVEHPITEMTTGVDLVRHQIEIAAGGRLCLAQDDIFSRGHAIECRIYAEDPENGFFPSPGTIRCYREPAGPGIRNDAGVYAGCSVPVEYDPILSKLTVYAETRDQAIAKMIKALKDYIVIGVRAPMDFLADVLDSSDFRSGDLFTDFIEQRFGNWQAAAPDADLACLAFIAEELSRPETRAAAPARSSIRGQAVSGPFRTLGQWTLR